MANKGIMITSLYLNKLNEMTTSPSKWTSFLQCAGINYKYSFHDQVLIYAQRPDAIACAEAQEWKDKLKRWINAKAKGIALITENNGKLGIRYVFDVSDTHDRYYSNSKIDLWQYDNKYENEIIDRLENKFGTLEDKADIIRAIESTSMLVTQDVVTDYLKDLLYYKDDSFLEDLDNMNIEYRFKTLIRNSVSYMVMKRCNIESSNYFSNEDFIYIKDFNTYEIKTRLGVAISDISKMILKEIERVVKNINRRFENQKETSYYINENERSGLYGYNNNLSKTGGIQSSKLANTKTSANEGTRKIRTDETKIYQGEQKGTIYSVTNEQSVDETFSRNTGKFYKENRSYNRTNKEKGKDYRTNERAKSNEVDSKDESNQVDSRGTSNAGTNLQLSDIDLSKINVTLPYIDDELILKILKEAPKLKDTKEDIKKYFDLHSEMEDREKYIKNIFGKEYTEFIVDEKRVGYKKYNNAIYFWTGNYLNRDSELCITWDIFASYIDSLIKQNKLLDYHENISNYGEQLQLIDFAEQKKSSAFSITQENIDYVLADGSNFEKGKFRIYEQLQKGLSSDENVKFLKKEYGIGGRSADKNGISEEHSPKGIKLTNKNNESILIKWNKVEKRLRELISLDRYLSENEKEEYKKWINKSELDEIADTLEKEVETNSSSEIEELKKETTQEKIDYHIENNLLGEGTPKEKYKRNIDAIKILKLCEKENRLANTDEQKVLSQFVGWGGLYSAFDENNLSWKNEYLELKEILTDSEYNEARESTLTAFYTPPIIIETIYNVLQNIGVKNANILEPSCGIGNFFGMLPEELKNCKLYGIELDKITGRIAKQLYQNATININGFEKVELPDSFFDIAVGNVPFGNFKLLDKKYDKNNFLIHDYFFAKTLDKIRPRGIIAFITSKGTLDKENIEVRKYIAQRAELLGAIRLPNDVFKKNAGTEVTADIIFLQKREYLTDKESDWIDTDVNQDGIVMNKYFIDNPNMIIGNMVMESTQYGMDSVCKRDNNHNFEEMLSNASNNIKATIKDYEFDEVANDEKNYIPADINVRNFSYVIVDEKIYFRENSKMFLKEFADITTYRIKGLIEIRDCVRTLMEYQINNHSDEDILKEQQNLNRLYDNFTKKYGLINSRANSSAFCDDSSYYLLCSLEILDENGKFLKKADIFNKRTIMAQKEINQVDTANEALILSLAEKAYVDFDYMCSLTGKDKQSLISELGEEIYKVPREDLYVTADEYLSGDIREKLEIAKNEAKINPIYEINVKALEKVLPKEIAASEISVRLGATWIPQKDIENFIFELLSTPYYAQYKINVRYFKENSEWNIEGKSYDRDNVKAYATYGTRRVNAYKIIEKTLNLRDVRVYDKIEDEDGNEKKVLNKKETAIAQSKQELIKNEFSNWIWKDPTRRERLTKLYNKLYNSIRPRVYDGSNLRFVGINPEIFLGKHQVNGVAHILYGKNTLLAQVVGAGKTFIMIAAAMESKRLGLCNKSLFVVPNHIIEQFANDFLLLYPSANILVASKKDFLANNRKKFCSRIATGDYDAVIIGHSQFEKIPISFERQKRLLQEQISDIVLGIKELKQNNAESISIKQLEKTKKSLEYKLEKLNNRNRKDDVVTFEELGVDKLFVDEAHYYKNLFYYTKMRNVSGLAQTDAQKSSDLFMKCRYLDEITNGRGVVFATGTPISNSMAELYTMQRYLQYDTLVEKNLQHFDSWAANYGETVTALELAPEGTGYRSKTRFSKFYNLTELMAMFKEIADIQTSDTLNLDLPEAIYHNVVVEPSIFQKDMIEELAQRAKEVRDGNVAPNVDNMLKITNDGRKLALDQRLINPKLPDFEGSKTSVCSENIYKIWNETKEESLTQLVFCDSSTPSKDKFNVYDDIKEKLVEKGIPSDEIAFIHDYDSELKKKELFSKVRKGKIRVLMGSTQKMGAGTNVQDKLIAIHDLDCPWRPSDLMQRLGRILRQGNQNSKVHVFRYVTKCTFDAYLYQLLENKQKYSAQIMTSKEPSRTVEEIDEVTLSYAEIKALATDNPLIIEKTQLDSEVRKLNLLKQEFLNQKYYMEDRVLKFYPREIDRLETIISNVEDDIKLVEESTNFNSDKFSPMTINGVEYTNKFEAGKALLEMCSKSTTKNNIIGRYRGLEIDLFFDTLTKQNVVNLKGKSSYNLYLGNDELGNIRRLDNAIESMENKVKKTRETLNNTKIQFENSKNEVNNEFPQEKILQEKSKRLYEVNSLLNINEKENQVLCDNIEDDEIDEKGRDISYER